MSQVKYLDKKSISLRILFLACIMLSSIISLAQDLNKHNWKDRLLLVITNDDKSADFQKQLAELRSDIKGLKERKLFIYQVLPSQCSTQLDTKNQPPFSCELFQKFNSEATPFKAVLIGLDGGVKLEQNQLLTLEKLFAVIDGMPMRRAEIKEKDHE